MTSHANDEVHDYLLQRLRPAVDAYDYVHLSEDLISNATYHSSIDGATYFEGTNILVKIDGTNEPSSRADGVVFSAHYDSVSTAYGATDNGIGVITILQLIEYFSVPERRPRCDAPFFLNNGEEDGLNGIHLLYEHPWSNLTSTFINLEGAGAGGCVCMFFQTQIDTQTVS